MSSIISIIIIHAMVIIHVTSPRANDGGGVAGGGGGGIGRVAGAPLLQSDAAPATGDCHWSSITVSQLLSPCISGDDVVVVESFCECDCVSHSRGQTQFVNVVCSN